MSIRAPKIVLGEFDPFEWAAVSTKPPKGTSLHEPVKHENPPTCLTCRWDPPSRGHKNCC